ncbi:hypothetical protein [Nostoc sp.]
MSSELRAIASRRLDLSSWARASISAIRRCSSKVELESESLKLQTW